MASCQLASVGWRRGPSAILLQRANVINLESRYQSCNISTAQRKAMPSYLRSLHASSLRRAHEPQPSNHELASASTATLAQSQSPTPHHGIAAKPKRSLRPYIYTVCFLLIGMTAGQFVRAIILPPPLPEPDSPEDEFMISKIRKDVDNLPIVKELRARRDEWLEYEAYMTMPPETMASSLTAGTLQGSRGLGVQRIFWNKQENRLISVVFFGGALSGWPGVTHGGLLATLLQENLERVASGPEFLQPSGTDFRLENVAINYKKPASANALYIIRAEVNEGNGAKATAVRHMNVKATMENALAGYVVTEASGTCSPRRTSLTDWAK